jgi:hypothetical protein
VYNIACDVRREILNKEKVNTRTVSDQELYFLINYADSEVLISKRKNNIAI